MTNQLIRQVNTWLHYVGNYYKTTNHFIREARKYGITRRVPVKLARGMQYGDRMQLLRWQGGDVIAFAEIIITGIVLEGEIAKQVGEKLQEQGRAKFTPGGGIIQRECGAYHIDSSWEVDAEISEVVSMATEIAEQEGKKIFCMVSGKLTLVYDQPIALRPAPPFTRSFIRADEQATFELHGQVSKTEKQVVSISRYQKGEKRKSRKGVSLALAPAS